MKHILFLLLFLPVLAYAQFPANPNKIRLGNQTTADGLVVRTAASPSWTPSTINNAWLAFDTVAEKLYYYDGGAWNEYTGGSVNFANTDLTLSGNREHNLNSFSLRFRDSVDNYPDLFLNGTYGLLGSDANTYLDVGSTAGRARIVAATTAQLTSAGNTDVSATDTVVVTGQRIRLNAADTRIQQVPNDNALNRLVALDSLTGRLYYVDKSSISGGGGSGTVTGSGTTGTIPVWSSSTALGDSPLTVSSGNVTATGTGAFRLPNGTTAERPGTPLPGETRYNTSLGYSETYGVSAWLQSDFPTGTTSQTLRHDGTSWAVADALKTTTAGIQVATGANAGVFIGGGSNVRYTSFSGVNTSALYMSAAGATGDMLIGYQGGSAITNVINYWQSSGNIASRGRLELGATSGADCLNWDNYQIQAKTAFNGFSSQGGVWVSGSLLATTGSSDSYCFRGNTSFQQSGAYTHNAFGLSLTPTFSGTVAYTAVELRANQGKGLYQVGATTTNHLQGATIIGDTITPARTFHVTGEARITDLTTDTPTQIVGADADGDLGAITVGTGLSLSGGTLTATGVSDNIYTANGTLSGARTVTLGSNTLTFTGTGGAPAGVNFSMNPSTNTTTFQSLDGSLNNSAMTITPSRTQIVTTNVTAGTAATYGFFADSVRISPAAVPNDDAQTRMLAINATTGRLHYVTKSTINAPSYNLAELTVSGGSTSATAGTPERPDNDTPGTATSTLIGTFTASGSTLDYTGAAGQGKVSAVISFTTSGGGEVLISIYKEGTEIASTEMREAVNAVYTTVALPTITTALAANDTFEIRIEPVTGSNTITVHRSTMFIEKIY